MNDAFRGDPVRDLRVAVIGAGMAGIASVIKLREAGIYDVTVFEKARDVGGTWRENTYPGIACDVPSHLYSYSFAPHAGWTHRSEDRRAGNRAGRTGSTQWAPDN